MLIFTDEASFRQDTTLHATWSRVGRAPEFWVTGERKTVYRLTADLVHLDTLAIVPGLRAIFRYPIAEEWPTVRQVTSDSGS